MTAKGKRVLVCGGRDFADESFVITMLSQYEDHYGPFSCIIHGGAKGADTLAGVFAQLRQMPVQVFPANWKRYGKLAGPIRNGRMLEEGKPDLVIAFPGGKGTADMINRAFAHGIMCIDVAKKAWP